MLQQPRHRHADRLRRDHRGLRPHHGARGQRPRLPLRRAWPTAAARISRSSTRSGLRDDQGAGRRSSAGSRDFDAACSRRSAAAGLSWHRATCDRRCAMTDDSKAEASGRRATGTRFFGFGTNILVNLLVLTGLLRFVLKMPDELVFGRILPATRPDDVPRAPSTTPGSPTGSRRRPGAPTCARCPRASACRTCSSSCS